MLITACSQTSREKALQTAKDLASTGKLSDTEAIENLQTSRKLLQKLVEIKISAEEWNIYIIRRLVKHYRNQEMWPKAIREINKLTRLQPTEARWYLLKGRVYSQWSRVDESKMKPAVEALNVAIDLDPEMLEAKYSLALLRAFRQKKWELGRKLLRDIAYETEVTSNNRPMVRKARFALGKLEFERGNTRAAKQVYETITKMKRLPLDSKFLALKHLARCQKQLGARQLAANTYKKAAEIKPGNRSVREALRSLGVSGE